MRHGMQILNLDEKGILPIVHTKGSWVIANFPRFRSGTLYILCKYSSAGYGFKLAGHCRDLNVKYSEYAGNFVGKSEQESIFNALKFCYRNRMELEFSESSVMQFFDHNTLMNWLDEHYPNLNPENRVRMR